MTPVACCHGAGHGEGHGAVGIQGEPVGVLGGPGVFPLSNIVGILCAADGAVAALRACDYVDSLAR